MIIQQSEINTEVLHEISAIHSGDESRFVAVGSIARGVLLGNDSLDLVDPSARRFLDVDVIDREGVLMCKHTLGQGVVDAQPTKSVRPVSPYSQEWGFYDRVSQDASPISTFPEIVLGLGAIAFSRAYPEDRIITPQATSVARISDLYRYTNNMPKHHDQLAALAAMGPPNEHLVEAIEEYNTEMAKRYPAVGYLRIRKALFNSLPWLALSVQEGKLGTIIRAVRRSEPEPIEPITLS
jgi:hypothetical protein